MNKYIDGHHLMFLCSKEMHPHFALPNEIVKPIFLPYPMRSTVPFMNQMYPSIVQKFIKFRKK